MLQPKRDKPISPTTWYTGRLVMSISTVADYLPGHCLDGRPLGTGQRPTLNYDVGNLRNAFVVAARTVAYQCWQSRTLGNEYAPGCNQVFCRLNELVSVLDRRICQVSPAREMRSIWHRYNLDVRKGTLGEVLLFYPACAQEAEMATTRRGSKVQSPLERRDATPSTGASHAPLAQAHPQADFLTLVGPLRSLERVIDQWRVLAGAANTRQATLPRILTLPPAAEEYADQAVLRVAVVRHAPNLGSTLVRRLRIQMNVLGIPDVYAEEGYYLSFGGSSKMAGKWPETADSWSMDWNHKHLDELHRNFEVTLTPDILGAAFTGHWEFPCKISLIDSGDEGAVTQTGFDIESTAPEPPSDHHGHGTSVGSLIRMIAPHVELHSYRIFRPEDNSAESGVLLNAVTSAMMMIGVFQIVLIPQRANLSPRTHGQRDSIQRIIWQNAQRSCPTPVVVCAAGNEGSRKSMSYPATVPGVTVAVALDWSGRVADYNCSPPKNEPVFTVQAFGGIERDPLGHASRPKRGTQHLYGSSYAAALVAGAIASQAAAPR